VTSFVPGSIRRTIFAAIVLLAAVPAAGEDDSWWLNVFFHIDGEWQPGREFDGWSAREYGSREECAERKAFAELKCREAPLDYPAHWYCSPGEPMSELPEGLRGTYC
jgi:hypothetical protein